MDSEIGLNACVPNKEDSKNSPSSPSATGISSDKISVAFLFSNYRELVRCDPVASQSISSNSVSASLNIIRKY